MGLILSIALVEAIASLIVAAGAAVVDVEGLLGIITTPWPPQPIHPL